jgi:hypothetical protein
MLTGSPSSGPPFRETTPKAVLGPSKPPPLHQCLGHHKADVVGCAGVLPARIAKADYQPVDGSATATKGASQSGLLLA